MEAKAVNVFRGLAAAAAGANACPESSGPATGQGRARNVKARRVASQEQGTQPTALMLLVAAVLLSMPCAWLRKLAMLSASVRSREPPVSRLRRRRGRSRIMLPSISNRRMALCEGPR